MIRLRRNPIPPALEDWLRERATRLRECLDRNDVPAQALLDAYKHPPLKAHLVQEAHGKCIYCESKITHVYFGDIEHIRPKSKFPNERLNLENLSLACARCNNAKAEFWNDDVPLLNPYQDEPKDEIFVFGFLIAHVPGRNRARLTISRLDLNRPELVERRKERFESLQPLADQYAQAPEGPLRNLLRSELLRQAADDREYIAVVRAYLEACGLQLENAA